MNADLVEQQLKAVKDGNALLGWTHNGNKRFSKDTIRSIQNELNSQLELNPKLDTDGGYGKLTVAAVKEFQRRNNLTQDGVLGPKTVAVLFKAEFEQQTAEAKKTAPMVEPVVPAATKPQVPADQTARAPQRMPKTPAAPKPEVSANVTTAAKDLAEAQVNLIASLPEKEKAPAQKYLELVFKQKSGQLRASLKKAEANEGQLSMARLLPEPSLQRTMVSEMSNGDSAMRTQLEKLSGGSLVKLAEFAIDCSKRTGSLSDMEFAQVHGAMGKTTKAE